jgi:hypothetical protein
MPFHARHGARHVATAVAMDGRADQCVAANALQSKLIRAFFEASCSRTTYRHGTRRYCWVHRRH